MKPFFYKTTDGRIVKKENNCLFIAGERVGRVDLIPVGEVLNCTTLGYKVNDQFRAIKDDSYYSKGDVYELFIDDRSAAPMFTKVSGVEASSKRCFIRLVPVEADKTCLKKNAAMREKVLDAMKKVGYVDVTLPAFSFTEEELEALTQKSAAAILHHAFEFSETAEGHAFWFGCLSALMRSEEAEREEGKKKITMDGKYKTKTGKPVRILCVDRKHSAYPVVALVSEDSGVEATKAYTAEGFYYDDKTEHDSNLVPVKEEVFTRDQLVEVSDSGVSWTKAHFSHKTDEAFHVFADGRTSHTNKGSLPWNYCRAA